VGRSVNAILVFGPAGVIAVAAAGMLAWSAGRWPDLLVDFGRELYLPWRIASGARLYADLAYLHGPLSPHLNALVFRLLGVSLRSLVLANLAILTVVIALLYRLLARVSSRAAAGAACVMFLGGFAFAHLTGVGNYNWICPYAHELTHGIAAALAGIVAVDRYAETERPRWMALAGLAVGVTFLTDRKSVV